MKTIGVIPLIDYGRNSYWMIPGYLKGLQTAGALPVILPVIESLSEIQAIMEMCDGFLFTGGQDVEPALYHSEKAICAVSTNSAPYEHAETLVLRHFQMPKIISIILSSLCEI